MLLTYKIITFFFYPIIIILTYLRVFIKKEDPIRFKEKIFSSNFFCNKNKNKKLIWVHAASVGEVQSIFPLLLKFNKERKEIEFLITTLTVSAAKIVERKIKKHKNFHHRYFPLDIDFLMKKFLNVWKPDLIMFVDSEIWPNLITQIKKRNIPSALINARITKKTFTRWMLISRFAKKIFSTFDLCLASSNETMKYLKDLNAKNIKYIGNIKFTGSIDKKIISNKNEIILRKKKFWCALSTHDNEEVICLKTHLHLKKYFQNIITVIIPRHINRSFQIKLLCDDQNLSSQILNYDQTINKKSEIIIVNSFGTVPIFLKNSKSVFVGKSMIKKLHHVSGQNPIEAAMFGCKVYHGPHVYNFNEIYKLLKSYKVSERVNNDKELSKKLLRDFKNRKKNERKINNIISKLGSKILNKSFKEINILL